MKQFTNNAITVRLGIQPPLDPEIVLPGRASISDSDCAQVYGYRVLEQLRGVAAKCAFRIGHNAIEEDICGLPANLDTFFQEPLVTCRVDIVLGANVFLQARTLAQHDR